MLQLVIQQVLGFKGLNKQLKHRQIEKLRQSTAGSNREVRQSTAKSSQ